MREVGVGSVLGDSAKIVVELVVAVGAEVRRVEIALRQFGTQILDLLDTVVGESHNPSGDGRVATTLLFGCPFEHQDTRTALARDEYRTERGVTGPDHYNVIETS